MNRKRKKEVFRKEAEKIAVKYGPSREKWVLDSLLWAWDCGWKDSARTHGFQDANRAAALRAGKGVGDAE
jgi:hypothetical protein